MLAEQTAPTQQERALGPSLLLKAVVENASVALFFMDERQHCVFMNGAAERLTGYTLDEVRGRPLHDVIHHTRPDGSPYPLAECAIDRAFPEKNRQQGEEVFVHRDGHFYPVAFTASPLREEDEDSPRGTIIEVIDLTAAKQAEADLRESESRFRRLADAAPAMLWVTDERHACTFLSRGWYEYTGQTDATGVGCGWLDASHPDDAERVKAAFFRAAERREAFQIDYRLRRADGEYRWVIDAGRPRLSPTGELRGYVGSVIDTHERKLADARFRQLADTIPQLAWYAEPDGYITWYNRRWHEYTGTTPKDMEGWGWQSVHDPEYLPRVVERWKASIATGRPFEMEFPLRGADGRFRMFLTRVEPLRDDAGRIVHWFGTNTDVEERRQLLESERAARKEAERVSLMKDEFLATLSHELRTPLNAISGWAQMMQTGRLSEAETRQAVEVISRNAAAQKQLIEDLLDMSRIISGKVRLDVQRVDLADVVGGALDSVGPTAQAKGVRLEKVIDPLAGPVSGDPSRLQQVVWNLLANAVKFTPRGGRVQVTLERVNSHLEIVVSDTGIGIRPEALPHVFDRFWQADSATTRQHGGLGLGLSVVKQLVEMHNGQVRAKSPGDGLGATFVVALPLALARHDADEVRQHPRTPTADACEPPALSGLKILAVEDDRDGLELVRKILESAGASVVTAASGPAGLDAVERDRPDAIVSDIGMPGMDGYEFMRRVRALGRDRGGHAPAVAVTAFARSQDRQQALIAGFQAHVAKPIDPGELCTVVASVAGRLGQDPGIK